MHTPDERPALPGTPTAAPVPPRLAETFGYPGACRLVAFYWEPAGDEVVYDDGRLAGTGDGHAFRAFRRYARQRITSAQSGVTPVRDRHSWPWR